jgi:hypothetical protein
MPVYPLVWHFPSKTGDYPHMGKNDAALWERFLDEYAGTFARVAYDVAVGGFRPDEATADEATRLGWHYSTAKKIDAVGERADDVWTMEVRPHASLGSVGNALGYAILAEIDGFTRKPIVACVVTDYADADIEIVAGNLDVVLVQLDKRP